MAHLLLSEMSVPECTLRINKHMQLVGPYADAYLKRRSLHLKHPVHDFLFTYYNFSPAKLKQWMPSIDEGIRSSAQLLECYPWLNSEWLEDNGRLLYLNRRRLHGSVMAVTRFIVELCDNVLKRAPRFGCFGLHEWAMVYKASPDSIRHAGYRLRLPPAEVAGFVESQALCCSHYDAYRFFTEEARPLNLLKPQVDTRLQMEQAGCLHANMDLYKWAAKLWPWIGSEFIAKTFFLALEGRELDMRASPYDLENEGYNPICVETEEGRRQYQHEQQLLTVRATPLRLELRDFAYRLLQSGSS